MLGGGWRLLICRYCKRPVAQLPASAPFIRQWFQSLAGLEFLSEEQVLIEKCIEQHKIKSILQISPLRRGVLVNKGSTFRLHVQSCETHAQATDEPLKIGSLRVAFENQALPFADDEFDFVLIQHSLEFSRDPHAVLREAVRVLAPQGQISVVGFNPNSLFGLRKLLQLLLPRTVPWAHHALTKNRLLDWLKLMDCEPVNLAYGFYGFPIQNSKWLRWNKKLSNYLSSHGISGGGFYALQSIKQVDRWVGAMPLKKRRYSVTKFPQVLAHYEKVNK